MNSKSLTQGITNSGPMLSGLAASLVVAFGVVMPASQAEAATIYSGPVNIAIPVTTSGIYLNVVTGVSSATPASVPGWDINPLGTSNLFLYANNAASPADGVVTGLGSSTTLVDNLPLGTLMNGSLVTGRTGAIETTGATAFVLNSTANYIGFKFLNETTGVLDYGWMQFSLGSTAIATSRSIVAYAYENTGAGIAVGSVPEPSSFAMLGLGVLGLMAVRLRR